MVLDCIGVVGRTLFLFKVLHDVDSHVAVVLATAVCQVPGVVKLTSLVRLGPQISLHDEKGSRQRTRILHYVYLVAVLLAVLVQWGAVPALYLHDTIASLLFGNSAELPLRLPALWVLIVYALCSSAGWWENYAYGRIHHHHHHSHHLHQKQADQGFGFRIGEWFSNVLGLPPGWGLSTLRADYGRIRQTTFLYTGPVQMIVLVTMFLVLTNEKNDVSVNVIDQLGAFFGSFGAAFTDKRMFDFHIETYSLVYMQVQTIIFFLYRIR
jgi:hypothetical protein